MPFYLVLLSAACILTSLPLYFNYELFYFNFALDTKDSLARNPKKPIRYIAKLILIALGSIPTKIMSVKEVIIINLTLHILNGTLFILENCRENTLNDQLMGKIDGIASLIYVSVMATNLLLHLFPV